MNKITEFFQKIATSLERFYYKTFTPSNVLRIRNVPKHWIDRDGRFFHASFTVMMDFVDYEMGGESGLEKYINNLRQEASIESVKDAEIQQFDQMIKSHFTMLELYRWYSSVNWENPVRETPEYLELLKKAEIKTEKTDHGTYKLVTVGVNEKEMNRHRAIHAAREQKFERLKLKKLHLLCDVHVYFWN